MKIRGIVDISCECGSAVLIVDRDTYREVMNWTEEQIDQFDDMMKHYEKIRGISEHYRYGLTLSDLVGEDFESEMEIEINKKEKTDA